MTAEQIKTVLDREPFITARGLEVDRKMTDARAEKFRLAREDLEADVGGCSRAERWLSHVTPTKKVGRRSSYSLKHMAEKATGDYVSNGALIVAALHLGFRYVQDDDNLNAAFNMSERSIKAAPCRITTRADGTVVEIRPIKEAK